MGGKVPRIEIWYSNPPSSGVITIRRKVNHPVWGSGWLEREVGPNAGLLSSPEAAAYLEITLVWLYHLVKERKLRPTRKKGHLAFKYQELRRCKEKKQKRGAPSEKRKKRETWLIN